jgi:transposase
MRKPYPSDMTDQQWDIIQPLIPVNRLGRRRKVDMREVLNTIFYQAKSGCQWDMLPHDLLPKSTVHDYFSQWRDDGTWQTINDALRQKVRLAAGREPSPSVSAHKTCNEFGLGIRSHIEANRIDWFHPKRKTSCLYTGKGSRGSTACSG